MDHPKTSTIDQVHTNLISMNENAFLKQDKKLIILEQAKCQKCPVCSTET